jgi:ribonuclease HI
MLVFCQGRCRTATQAFRIPDGSSTLQAELYGIFQALLTADNVETETLLIITDSLGAMQVIKQYTSTDNHLLLGAIHELIDSREAADQDTIFYWVPSHVGIPGNEAADKAAKKALQLEDIQNIPVSQGNQKTLIKRFCKPPLPDPNSHSISNYMKQVGTTRQMFPKDIPIPVQTDLLYTRLGYLLYRKKPFPRASDSVPCPDCREPYSYLHHYLQCTEHVPATHQLLSALAVDSTLDPEAAMQAIIQKSALQPRPLIEFLTQWPVPHHEFNDGARIPARGGGTITALFPAPIRQGREAPASSQ